MNTRKKGKNASTDLIDVKCFHFDENKLGKLFPFQEFSVILQRLSEIGEPKQKNNVYDMVLLF